MAVAKVKSNSQAKTEPDFYILDLENNSVSPQADDFEQTEFDAESAADDLQDEEPQSLISPDQLSISQKREDTRGTLAIIYTIATFLMFVMGFVVAVLDGVLRGVSIIQNLSTVLPLLSGIFLGTLGFVLGYYFRKSETQDREI